jgi:hypothetical protein
MPAAHCAARTQRITVDTTVQPKNISFPTHAKLLHAAIRGLNRLANKHGVPLRQSYLRIAKRAAMMAGRYAHAKQFNRHRRELRILRTRLGRLIRDIGRKIEGQESRLPDQEPAARPARLEAVFLPCPGDRVHRQGLGYYLWLHIVCRTFKDCVMLVGATHW